MKCIYCYKDLSKTKYVDEEEEGRKYFFEDYRCDKCQAQYCVIECNKHIVEITLRSNYYRLVLNRDNGSCQLQKGEPGEFEGVMGTYWENILKLEHSPKNVNPTNLAAKIKTMLVFS